MLTLIVTFFVLTPLKAPFLTVIDFLPLRTIVFTFLAPVNALLLINLIEAGSVILVAFVAFANALAFTVVTLYVTPFTLTVAETVTLLLLVAFTALTAAVPFCLRLLLYH